MMRLKLGILLFIFGSCERGKLILILIALSRVDSLHVICCLVLGLNRLMWEIRQPNWYILSLQITLDILILLGWWPDHLAESPCGMCIENLRLEEGLCRHELTLSLKYLVRYRIFYDCWLATHTYICAAWLGRQTLLLNDGAYNLSNIVLFGWQKYSVVAQ
jgi:hypothetical protein